ncbi:MAG: 4-hydroxythreonine-4-phosphate dehydrogenase PdxA [Holophagales bacterium]|jgi:4-hydroxythreonine-4-phosphate dehydrogenase|nr:4-hydroxythreonine-4-phosphate dehydrogenase PdxA [Holophagales bacterium]
MKQAKHLAITLGDPAGIGPEVLLKLLPNILSGGNRVTIYGSSAGLAILPSHSVDYKFSGGKFIFGSHEIDWADPAPEIGPSDLRLGAPSALSGRCAVEAVKMAAADVLSGRADALLTLPISKVAAQMAGYDINGHTELLQQITGSPKVRMAFVGPKLKVALHTAHQSLRSAIDKLSAESVADTLLFVSTRFAPMLGLKNARVALCALNPHAGEGGLFGNEELALAQAIEIAKKSFNGSIIERDSTACVPEFSGPWPADTIFQRASRGEFDIVVALYHDQGMIPVKLLEPSDTVNLTVGLPFIRTSPGHGTAFDIAGKWSADPSNALAAANLAFSFMG